MSEAPIARRVIVHGHVQGVFFRDSTRRKAQAAGATGWVANRPDGTLEAHVEGPPNAVEQVIAFLNVGPRGAEVHHTDAQPTEPQGHATFTIN
jgi:acylphosphatase